MSLYLILNKKSNFHWKIIFFDFNLLQTNIGDKINIKTYRETKFMFLDM